MPPTLNSLAIWDISGKFFFNFDRFSVMMALATLRHGSDMAKPIVLVPKSIPRSFMSFGKTFTKLRTLSLIGSETCITTRYYS